MPGENEGGPAHGVSRAEQLGWDESLYRNTNGDHAVPPPRPSADGGTGDGGDRGDGGGEGGDGTGSGRARRGEGKKKPRWRRVLVWTSAGLAFVLVAVAVAGFLYLRHLNSNLTKDELNLSGEQLERAEPNAAGQTPLNILLLGSDSRTGDENQDLGGGGEGGQRADVQLLMHASADRSNISLISVPRDTMVSIPECTDPDTGEVYPEVARARINSALDHGGPGCVVATWERMTDIPIDHFMLLDFAGVVEMADAVGGVPVCVDANIYDDRSQLRLEEGTTVVEGEQALQWLRTRHGFENGSDAIGRTRAQQMYLSNMADELQSGTSLTNPTELMDLAEAATSALTVDHGLGSVQRLYELGEDLRDVPGDRINSVTLPWLPDPLNPDATVIPDPEKAADLFELVRGDIPLDDQDAEPAEPTDEGEGGGASESPETPADPAADIPVAVRNGTGDQVNAPVDGRAGVITDELHRQGFLLAGTDATEVSAPATQVLHPDGGNEANAHAVAEALGIPAEAVLVSATVESVTVVIGADWREGTAFPAAGAEPTEGDAGGETDDEGPVVDEESILGGDDESCMSVNPAYTW
ncbi:LytR family transcriptional regulator [Streptomyces radicis]|uniref:LytR family transcriptional regulator n=1 Tax=Streptomyces radicis TaxID=1750517 RepID=A0A3A9W6F5_9ACTN|nr:LytR family transcriptional regulator [Streptomyces radicis]RKN21933.1 LytR family transcriptional regulator [Streptomyces radicis]